MTAPVCDRDALEKIGFRAEGMAQTLYAFAVSASFSDQSEAMRLLSVEAQEICDYITAHVEAKV